MDPITAIANAAGSWFESIGKGLEFLALPGQRKIVSEQNKGLDLLNENERIKYNELISTGNYTLASQLLQSKSAKTSANNNLIYIIIGFTFLIVMLIIYLKIRKK